MLDGIPEPAHVDVDRFKSWPADAQQQALDLIRQREINPWRPFYCPNWTCDGEPHGEWTWPHARADQRPPPLEEDWLVWLLSGGRGSGKTRSGAELTHRMTERVHRIALIAPTGNDIRDTMVEGESGILATSPPDKIPLWEPSKKRLTWPNGAQAQGFSGEEPDRLRGPQQGFIWIDEPAHIALIQMVWDNMLFGLRLGTDPRVCATTTPTPSKWMRALIKDPLTVVSRVSTYANLRNLAPTFKRTILDKYEGTRLGQQELHGMLLEDVEGALWTIDLMQHVAIEWAPDYFDRIVVSVDPAGSVNFKADDTGIIVVGIKGREFYVLEDRTGKYSPAGWAQAASAAYEKWAADCIVAEKNYGGLMVKQVLENNGAHDKRIVLVESRRGKAIRAEPIVALYEKQRVFHLKGATLELEEEMTNWVPGVGESPNRVDALVHAITNLGKLSSPAQVASPRDLPRIMPATGPFARHAYG